MNVKNRNSYYLTVTLLWFLSILSASAFSATERVRVSFSNDDAEERIRDGDMYLNSTDLEFGYDGYRESSGRDDGLQIVGMRFRSVDIPQGAIINSAYIEFTVDENDDGATSLTIFGEDGNSPDKFNGGNKNISKRNKTSASVNWAPSQWNKNSVKKTPNIKIIIQEIVNRTGWVANNNLVLIVEPGSNCTGSRCQRTAESYDGEFRNAPLLVVDYTVTPTLKTPIFSSSDSILGGQLRNRNFNIGIVGKSSNTNNWPGNEHPGNLIDGFGQKYLNFGELNTGALITPVIGCSIVDTIKFWTANDNSSRDPASYELYGTNEKIINGLKQYNLSRFKFTLISDGDLELPTSRNANGGSTLDDNNAETISFLNTSSYTSYLLLFPSVKKASSANSMQLGEVQVFGSTCSDPTPVIDHYDIQHDGQGLTCEAEDITIKACTNASCSELSDASVTLDLLANGSTVGSPTFTGIGNVSFNNTSIETLTLSVANASASSLNPYTCNGSSNSSTCNIAFTDAGFRFISGAGSSTTIPNQKSGSVFGETLKIQAVKDTKGVCTGLFSGARNINLSQENVEPGGSNGLSFSVNGKDIAKHSSVTSTALSFGTDSIAIIPNPLYNDAGKIRLHANYTVGQGEFSGVKLSGSSKAFWVSPTKLVVNAKSGTTSLNGSTATATPIHAAGDDFELTVAAYNAASPSVITPNYSPGKIQLKLTRTGPTLTESVDGKLKYATSSMLATSTNAVFEDVTLNDFSSGVSTYAYAQYSEVGLFKLDVKDRDYGDSSIIISAAEINIGRFTPAYFEQIVVDDGDLSGTCNTGKKFAYSGQKDDATNSIGTISYSNNPILEITAYNNQGDITQNYYEDSEGSVNDFMALSGSDVSIIAPTLDQVTIGIDPNKLLPLTANMNTGILSQSRGGVLHYQFSDDDNFVYTRDENSRVRPFISDIDFSIASIEDTDGVKATTTVAASPIGVEIRFGRLVLKNSFGPETSDLAQPMQIEYFDGNNFVISADDNCASYDADNILLTKITLDPAVTKVLGGKGDFIAGETRVIQLEAPGVGNKGDIRVEYETYPWLKYDWANDKDGLYDDNPSAVATFGLFGGNDRVIYKRRLN